MRLLLDTHVLVWSLSRKDRLPADFQSVLQDEQTQPFFSVVSIWELAIKNALGRATFQIDPQRVRQALLDNDYRELNVTGVHTLAISELPPIHRDPFDRMLVAQSMVEGIELVTTDSTIARYPGSVRLL